VKIGVVSLLNRDQSPETSCPRLPPAIESSEAETSIEHSGRARKISAIPRGFGRSALVNPKWRPLGVGSVDATASYFLHGRFRRFGLVGPEPRWRPLGLWSLPCRSEKLLIGEPGTAPSLRQSGCSCCPSSDLSGVVCTTYRWEDAGALRRSRLIAGTCKPPDTLVRNQLAPPPARHRRSPP
jgi:hypothetical protein